jgi:hypothetical protein
VIKLTLNYLMHGLADTQVGEHMGSLCLLETKALFLFSLWKDNLKGRHRTVSELWLLYSYTINQHHGSYLGASS